MDQRAAQLLYNAASASGASPPARSGQDVQSWIIGILEAWAGSPATATSWNDQVVELLNTIAGI